MPLMHIGKDDNSVVGELRGDLVDGLDDEIRTETTRSCPLCGSPLFLIEGYKERIIIDRIVAPHLAEITDIPDNVTILSCKECRRTFTEVR